MRLEDLFLDTMEDLRRRCDLRATEYDMVQAAGLLRRLVLDGASLWTLVNRDYRIKPVCSWARVYSVGLGVEVSGLWLDPALLEVRLEVQAPYSYEVAPDGTLVRGAGMTPHEATVEGSLPDFLSYPAIRADGRDSLEGGRVASVADLINHFANREGGVHYDLKAAKKELIEPLRGAHDEPLRLTLVAAGRIVHRALEPLAARVAFSGRDGLLRHVVPPLDPRGG